MSDSDEESSSRIKSEDLVISSLSDSDEVSNWKTNNASESDSDRNDNVIDDDMIREEKKKSQSECFRIFLYHMNPKCSL